MNAKLPGSISGAPPPPSPPLQEPAPQVSEEDEEEDKGMFTDLLDDGEVEEAATKQRALLVLFEKKWCDEAAWQFMLGETRAEADRLR
jgi:hypothetical protein